MLRDALTAAPNWVLSGSICNWGDELAALFHLAVFVTAPTSIRLERLRTRERARFADRIDPGGDMHDQHLAFLDWAAAYDDGSLDVRSRQLHENWILRLRFRACVPRSS
jgi:hypothetical protein